MFETNLRDERYLPFENSGVISEWQLQLPANPSKPEPAQFDYDTISDVILHLRYTAREGGGLLRSGALVTLKTAIEEATAAGSVRLFSVRHEFPSEWAKFQGQTPGANQRFELTINLRKEHYPFWSKDLLNSLVRVDILVRSAQNPVPGSMDIFDSANTAINTKKGTLSKDAALGNLLRGQLTAGLPAAPTGKLRFFVET
jgi:hypothetical protein